MYKYTLENRIFRRPNRTAKKYEENKIIKIK